jgi:hypothetical protein
MTTARRNVCFARTLWLTTVLQDATSFTSAADRSIVVNSDRVTRRVVTIAEQRREFSREGSQDSQGNDGCDRPASSPVSFAVLTETSALPCTNYATRP